MISCQNMVEEKENTYPLLQQEEPVPLALPPKQVDHKCSPTQGWKVYLKAIYFTLVASMGALSFGFTAAFSSPLLVALDRTGNQTPYPEVFEGEENCPYQVLIAPLAPIGAFLGALLSAVVVAIFGLVLAMMSAAVMFVMGWVMLGASFFVSDPLGFRAIILLGRFVTGFATGWIAATAPGYVAEIAPNDKLRGPLGSVILSAIGLGIFFSFLLGAYSEYWIVAFTFAGVSVVHLFLLLTLPESPRRKRNPVTNTMSLVKSKSNTTTVLSAEEREANNVWRFTRQAVIVVLLFALQQLIGPDVLTFYAGPLLIAGGDAMQDEASLLPPNAAASLAIGLVQTIGAFASMLFLERIGRKVALFIGALGMGLGSVGLTIYFGIIDTSTQLSNIASDNSSMVRAPCLFTPTPNPERGEELRPLAVVSMAVFIFSFISCWGPPLFSFGAEMFTDRWRGLGLGMAFAANWLCTAIITSLFPLIARGLGETIGFSILFVIAILTAIFIPLFVPETRGKPLGWSSEQDFSIKRNLMEFFQSFKKCICYCCLRRSVRLNVENDL